MGRHGDLFLDQLIEYESTMEDGEGVRMVLPIESHRRFFIAIGGAIVSAIGPTIIPTTLHTPFILVGLVMLAYGIWPCIISLHSWLSERIGMYLSIAVIAIILTSFAVAAGILIYDARKYSLSYKFCFSHLPERDKETGDPKVVDLYVAPILINDNDFIIPIELKENSLIVGDAASVEKPEISKIPIPPNSAGWGFSDYVTFDPPIAPGPMLGRVRYVFHYGKDSERPLDKIMVIKGTISGAVSPDGIAGRFSFTPDLDSAPGFNPEKCVIPKERLYVTNKRAL